MIKRFYILILCFASWSGLAQSQAPKNTYRIEGADIVMVLDGTTSRTEQEKFLDQFGMKGLSLDTLWRFGNLGYWAKNGWKLASIGRNKYKIYKPLTDLSGNLKWEKGVVVLNEYWESIQKQTAADFGYNSFKKPTVSSPKKGITRFVLNGNRDAHDVFLSGTFNGWSTLTTPMTKTDSGWVADVPLSPGKHCYKFVVGGRWMKDSENNRSEGDFHGGQNSIYFVTNQEFKLNGYETAREVIVAGTFNNWNQRQLKLKRNPQGWSLPVYLKDGTYGYKFLIDKKWITDPANPVVRDDGKGNKNSYLQLGEASIFRLEGFETARRVIVSGSFNNWNEGELVMSRTSGGWELPYVLAPGNYQYKFIIDGKWIMDPKNPTTGVSGGHTNSLMVVKANHTFFLKGFSLAKDVKLAGTFNGWTEYSMKKAPDGWVLDLYLPKGKCLYKFIVDGKWMIDPGNDLWEQNEYGNGNSVLWIASQ